MATSHAHKRITKKDLKTDAFTTSIFTAKEWAEKNVRFIAITLGAIVVVVAAVWGFSSYRSSEQLAAQSLYGEAGVEIRSNNSSVAIALLQRVVDEHGGAQQAGPACIQLGQLHFQERSFDEARLAYQRYIDDYAADPYLTAAAWAGLGAIEEQAGFPEEAVTRYREATDANPGGSLAPENLRRLVRAAVAAGDTATALAAFERLDQDYPEDADNRMIARQMLIERGFMDPN
ncbi:MAG TPA: tetratricopeptide repeat protein [Acidobacteriota bacterium]|nr:tetratricopeptide repeat protein [Acidobacteriota bacterium]